MSTAPYAHLEEKAKAVRRKVVEIIYRAKSSHIGCSLSVADILVAFYFGVMRIDPQNPLAEDRDRLVLSKGHSISALYATLAERGFFPKDKLDEYGRDGTALASHAVRNVLPGIETSTGSGGHGLPLGIGMALAMRRAKSGARVYVVSGDGEMAEGSMWEGVLFAGFHKLSGLTLVIDHNHLQDGQDGLHTHQILDLHSLEEKLRAFRWDVDVVDGHSFEKLIPALRRHGERPHAVVADTVKGKGVSFMEDRPEWHGKCPNEDEYTRAIQELA